MGKANRAEESGRGGEPRESLRRCDLTRKAKAKGKPSKEGDPHHPTEEKSSLSISPSLSLTPRPRGQETDTRDKAEAEAEAEAAQDGGWWRDTWDIRARPRAQTAQHSTAKDRDDRTGHEGQGQGQRTEYTEWKEGRAKSSVKSTQLIPQAFELARDPALPASRWPPAPMHPGTRHGLPSPPRHQLPY